MNKEIANTVWSYQAIDFENDYKRYRRTVFFYVGSTRYDGGWMGPSDCFWIVPGTMQED